MKIVKIIIPMLLICSILLPKEYMLDGRLYPETSYVIVNDEGWKIHYNQDGRVVNMTPPGNHNIEKGKYSFDKFGNLIPFIDYAEKGNIDSDDKDTKETNISLDIELPSIKDLNIGIKGQLNISLGDNVAHYPSGFGGGIYISWNKFSLLISHMSFAADNAKIEENIGSNADFDGSGLNLSATSFFLTYSIFKLNKLTFNPGFGIMSQKGVYMDNQAIEGNDLAAYLDISYSLTSKISLCFDTYYTINSWAGKEDETATFYGFGLNYKF